MGYRPDAPYRRVYDDGRVRWIARYTDPQSGKRRYARPDWNRRSATFKRRRDAQRAITEAIDAALQGVDESPLVAAYADRWFEQHPRADRTNRTNRYRIDALLDAELPNGRRLRDHELAEVTRGHVTHLIHHLLTDQGRSAEGARNILRTYSAMFEDAIRDGVAQTNPFRGAPINSSDPRIRKQPRPVRVYPIATMHDFAAHAPNAQGEVMIRVLSDCGLRLGEMLALGRADLRGDELRVPGTAHRGRIIYGDSPKKRHRRIVPVPPGLLKLLTHYLQNVHHLADSPLMFPTLKGRVWIESNWRRQIWVPTQERTNLDIRPHEMRHSYLSHLLAEGIDPADLAQIAGHTVGTLNGTYTHALERSSAHIREAIG